mmetsp:Transcript_36609/g.105297  ORF Transcript_36609/g.105297 Transcript_36609/m.105297 type:complete len:417 (-) Transcript_36609:17-1267(-)
MPSAPRGGRGDRGIPLGAAAPRPGGRLRRRASGRACRRGAPGHRTCGEGPAEVQGGLLQVRLGDPVLLPEGQGHVLVVGGVVRVVLLRCGHLPFPVVRDEDLGDLRLRAVQHRLREGVEPDLVQRRRPVADGAAPCVLRRDAAHCVHIAPEVEALQVVALHAARCGLDPAQARAAQQLHHRGLDVAQGVLLRHPVRPVRGDPSEDPLQVQAHPVLDRRLTVPDLLADLVFSLHRVAPHQAHGPLLGPLDRDSRAELDGPRGDLDRLAEVPKQRVRLHGVAPDARRQVEGPGRRFVVLVRLLDQHSLPLNEQGDAGRPAVPQLVAPLGGIDPEAAHLHRVARQEAAASRVEDPLDVGVERVRPLRLEHGPPQQLLRRLEGVAQLESAQQTQATSPRHVELAVADLARAVRRRRRRRR